MAEISHFSFLPITGEQSLSAEFRGNRGLLAPQANACNWTRLSPMLGDQGDEHGTNRNLYKRRGEGIGGRSILDLQPVKIRAT
jgi:hypothetical protein